MVDDVVGQALTTARRTCLRMCFRDISRAGQWRRASAMHMCRLRADIFFLMELRGIKTCSRGVGEGQSMQAKCITRQTHALTVRICITKGDRRR